MKDDEEDLGAVISAHRDPKLPGEDYRTFSITCIHGIEYSAKGFKFCKERLRKNHHPHNNLRHVVKQAGNASRILSAAHAETAPEEEKVVRTLVRTQSVVQRKPVCDQGVRHPASVEFNKFVFRFREFNKGKLLEASSEVSHFLIRVHEATIHNQDAIDYLRTVGGRLDLQAAAKHKERQFQKFTAKEHFGNMAMLEIRVVQIQKLFRTMKEHKEKKLSRPEHRLVVARSERDAAAIKMQVLYRAFRVRMYVYPARRRLRLQQCITAVRAGDVMWTEKVILRMGVNVLTRDDQSRSILHHAAASNQEHVIIKLAELCADLDAKDNKGNTALHVACAKRFVAAARRLVFLGADVEATNIQGLTPLTRPAFFLVSIVNEVCICPYVDVLSSAYRRSVCASSMYGQCVCPLCAPSRECIPVHACPYN
jgi:hypothetical protein